MNPSMRVAWQLLITLPLSLGSIYAAESPEFDFSLNGATTTGETDVGDNPAETAGFDFSFTEPTEEPFIADSPMEIPLRGKIAFDLGYQFGSPKRWQTVGPSAQLIFDWSGEVGQIYSELTTRYNRAYKLESDPQTTIDKYQISSNVRELYWKRALGQYSVTVGRTIVAWGKADLLPVIDVVSPSDSSSLLFAKVEELRLGQDLIKIDRYSGNSELNLIYTPSARHNLITDFGHPYSTMLPNVSDDIEDDESEWGIRWTTIDDRLEYGIIAGDFSLRDPLVVGTELTYVKSTMMGGNVIYSRAPFLWKGEFIFINDSPYQRANLSGYDPIDTLKATVGFDYASSSYGSWIVEYSGALTSSPPPTPLLGGSTGLIGISWGEQYLRDELSISVAVMLVGGTDNRLLRVGGSYKLDDEWTLTSQLTIINADSSEPLYQVMSGFDRLDLSMEYGFDLSQ